MASGLSTRATLLLATSIRSPRRKANPDDCPACAVIDPAKTFRAAMIDTFYPHAPQLGRICVTDYGFMSEMKVSIWDDPIVPGPFRGASPEQALDGIASMAERLGFTIDPLGAIGFVADPETRCLWMPRHEHSALLASAAGEAHVEDQRARVLPALQHQFANPAVSGALPNRELAIEMWELPVLELLLVKEFGFNPAIAARVRTIGAEFDRFGSVEIETAILRLVDTGWLGPDTIPTVSPWGALGIRAATIASGPKMRRLPAATLSIPV